MRIEKTKGKYRKHCLEEKLITRKRKEANRQKLCARTGSILVTLKKQQQNGNI